MSHTYARPWVVFRRAAGVVSLVSRHASKESASSKVRNLPSATAATYKHVDEMPAELRKALGISEGTWS